MKFTPCSVRHKSCSPAHAALVRGYREERERQETLNEMVLSNPAELKIWKENGNRLITFKDWLIGNKGSGKAHNDNALDREQGEYRECEDNADSDGTDGNHAHSANAYGNWSRAGGDGNCTATNGERRHGELFIPIARCGIHGSDYQMDEYRECDMLA